MDYEKESLEKRNEIFEKAYQNFAARFRFENEVDESYEDEPSGDGSYIFKVLQSKH